MGFTLGLGVFFGLMLIAYAWVVEDNVFNRMVADEAAYIEQVYREQGVVPQPQSRFMTLYTDWSELPETIQLLRRQSPDRVEFPLPDDRTVHLTTLKMGQRQMVLAADVTAFEVSRDYFPTVIGWLLALLAGVCAMALILSWRVSQVAVRPVERLARLVDEREPGSVVRFAADFPADETGYLAQTIEESINQLQQALDRESEFTRDVSHELRTPATVLTMLADQFEQNGTLSERQQADFTQAIAQIRQTVSVLLALARRETLEREPLNLLEQIETCAVNHYALSAAEDFELAVDVPPGFKVSANRNLLHLLLNNLFDNALNHGSSNRLSIELEGDSLSFVNAAGAEDVENLFDGHVKGAQSRGLGLGLNLVKRICESSGWDVDAINDGERFAVTIRFGSTQPIDSR